MNKKSIFPLIMNFLFSFLIIYVLYNIRFEFSIPDTHYYGFNLLIFSPVLIGLFQLLTGVYRSKKIITLDIAANIFISSLITFFIYLLVFMTIKIYVKNIEFSTPVILLTFLMIPLVHILVNLFFNNLFFTKTLKDNILIVGYTDDDEKTLDKYLQFIKDNYSIVGICGKKRYMDLELIAYDRDMFSIIEQYRVNSLLFCGSVKPDIIENIVFSSSVFDQKLLFFPDLKEKFAEWGLVKTSGILFELETDPISGLNYILQRSFDILFSVIGSLIFLPFGLIISVLISSDSNGPVFYQQVRIGKNGRPFKLIKFRTMFIDAEKDEGPKWAEKKDDRVTKIGRFLRRTSIDEIPQLLNVLTGTMSLVGPRPERPYFIEKHKVLNGARLLVKPGLTGLAQINGRYDLTPEEKVVFDLYFINHFSIFTYFSIVIKTIFIIIMGKGVR